MTDIEAQRHALQECWATYLRFVPLEFLPLLRSHCTQMQPHVKFKFELPTQNARAQVEAEIQRRADTKAQAEAPKFAVGDRVRILFDAHWRGQAYANAHAWEAADDPPLRESLEGEDGFVRELFPGKVLGERPKYGVCTCFNGQWDGGFYIFEECELETYTLPTLRRLRTVRTKDLAVGLRVRLALEGPLAGKTATITGLGSNGVPAYNLVQVILDEDFALGKVWSCFRVELQPLEPENVSDKPTNGENDV